MASETYGTVNDNGNIDEGWSMELAIPIEVFLTNSKFTPIAQGNIWNILILRQVRNDAVGSRTATSTLFPLAELQDVHQPQVFKPILFIGD